MQWGATDDAANSVLWAVAQLKKTPNTANRDALFGNTTADAYTTGQTVGVYGVSNEEATATRAEGNERVAHAGWQLRTVGSGGRAGRVFNETLVAMSISGDAEDTVFEDYFITITSQPQDASANSSSDDQIVFTVVATVSPSTTLTYQWEYTTEVGNTNSFTNADATGFSGDTTASLTLDANTIVEANAIQDGAFIRVLVSKAGADTKTSDNATLTITS